MKPLALAAFLLFSFASPVSAIPVTYNFTGTVTEVENPSMGIVEVGDSVAGHFTYETETPQSGPFIGSYPSGVLDFFVTVNGHSWQQSTTESSQVTISPNSMQFTGAEVYYNGIPFDVGFGSVVFQSLEPVFGFSIPEVLPAELFDDMFGGLIVSQTETLAFDILTLTRQVAPIPLPSSASLLSLALIAAFASRKRIKPPA